MFQNTDDELRERWGKGEGFEAASEGLRVLQFFSVLLCERVYNPRISMTYLTKMDPI